MKRWIPLVSFVVLSSPFAAAQSIVFQDGFEGGLSNWTATGFWNAEQSSDTCGSQAAPFPEGSGAAWYGSPSTCNFAFGGTANGGMLTLNTWVTLPTGAASLSLYFQSWVDSEYCWGNWDNHALIVTAQGGPNGGFTEALCSGIGPIDAQLPWHERRADLSQYAGAQVKIAFSFWTGDNAKND